MITMITLPNVADTFSTTSIWASGIFNSMLPVLFIGAGLLIGGLILGRILGWTVRGAKKAVGVGGRRRRGRRR